MGKSSIPEPDAVRLRPLPSPLPLEKAAGRNQAAPLPGCGSVGRLVEHGLLPGVDHNPYWLNLICFGLSFSVLKERIPFFA